MQSRHSRLCGMHSGWRVLGGHAVGSEQCPVFQGHGRSTHCCHQRHHSAGPPPLGHHFCLTGCGIHALCEQRRPDTSDLKHVCAHDEGTVSFSGCCFHSAHRCSLERPTREQAKPCVWGTRGRESLGHHQGPEGRPDTVGPLLAPGPVPPPVGNRPPSPLPSEGFRIVWIR